jgi:hypothetical protein
MIGREHVQPASGRPMAGAGLGSMSVAIHINGEALLRREFSA